MVSIIKLTNVENTATAVSVGRARDRHVESGSGGFRVSAESAARRSDGPDSAASTDLAVSSLFETNDAGPFTTAPRDILASNDVQSTPVHAANRDRWPADALSALLAPYC